MDATTVDRLAARIVADANLELAGRGRFEAIALDEEFCDRTAEHARQHQARGRGLQLSDLRAGLRLMHRMAEPRQSVPLLISPWAKIL